jgi:hypothetical protein
MAELTQHVYVDGQLYGPGSKVPADIAKRITNPKAWGTGETAAQDHGEAPADESGPAGGFDPTSEGVDEVNNYLAEADEDEVTRVLAAEAEGKARKGILEGPYAPDAEGA